VEKSAAKVSREGNQPNYGKLIRNFKRQAVLPVI